MTYSYSRYADIRFCVKYLANIPTCLNLMTAYFDLHKQNSTSFNFSMTEVSIKKKPVCRFVELRSFVMKELRSYLEKYIFQNTILFHFLSLMGLFDIKLHSPSFLSLYGRIRVSKNRYSRIFYAVMMMKTSVLG